MWTLGASVFALPPSLSRKSDPTLITTDEHRFAAIAASLEATVADLTARLDAERRAPGGDGQAAMDRDLEVHRLSARLRTLRRFSLDLCLGRMVHADTGEAVYVGRLGLTDPDGRQLLVDWRSPAAEPFFGATHARPMGLASRRRYRWTRGVVTDYWDEVFTADGLEGHAALDDQSAFIASLGANRTDRMRDVLGTIQADQDAIIRAGSRGALVVDGGPGTGKTVVALHRTAYLLYADPRLGHHTGARSGGVLFVGPHRPYLAYVSDVLPSLGEEGVRTCTLRDLVDDLVPADAALPDEADPGVAWLKGSVAMVEAIEPAVRFYEDPPTSPVLVQTPWAEVRLSPTGWARAFASADPGTPHNEARDQVWEELVDLLLDQHDLTDDDGEHDPRLEESVRRTLDRHAGLREAFDRAWPVIEATDLVGDLWDVPAYLRLCAPWLASDDVRRLRRTDPHAWTTADLPLLDAARQRLGDPDAGRKRRRARAAAAAERARVTQLVEDTLAAGYDADAMMLLRRESVQDALVDEAALPDDDRDPLAGPFAHVVVDEAQELTDAEWLMLVRRCPSRSLTVVGDRAQARHGFTESWQERLERVGLGTPEVASLRINYRTPEEVMAAAEPVIRAVVPDANVPVSVRSAGPVVRRDVADLEDVVDTWLETNPDGIACVIGAPGFEPGERVQSLSPALSKGLEFDLVVLVDPDSTGDSVEATVDRYVAMTRATQQLVVLTPEGG